MLNPWYLLVSMITGAIGFGACMYGKRMSDPKSLFIGIFMCASAYFVTNPVWLAIVGVVLCAGLFSTKILYYLEGRSQDSSEKLGP